MRPLLAAFLLCLVLAVSSCAETTAYETPYAQGKVIDASTKRPIGGVTVSVNERPEVTMLSAADGIFVLRSVARKAKVLALAPFESITPPGHATIQAPGYFPLEVNL